jgi:2-polyprenyl-6-methoxyphenol hydroxylase-like FAD-dependent oxidoreductase
MSPILIIGAGPTGLVLAIELARRGVEHVLIDQRPKPLLWDRAAVIKSRTLEIFAALSLSAEFLRRGTKIRGVDFYGLGTRRASFRLGELDTPFPFTLGLSEGITEQILTQELERLGGRVERGIEFVDLEADNTAVRARIRESGGERTFEASWLIGADGLHSNVRAAVGIGFPGHDHDGQWGVADVRFDNWPYAPDLAAVIFDPLFMPIPIGGDTWRAYFRPDSADKPHQAHIEYCLKMLAPGARVASSDEPQLFHTHSRVATQFRSGRVLLAGDAAHACSPIEGHGMNGGIHDAFNLGWKLALVASGKAPESLLDSYDAERRPIAGIVGASGEDAEAGAAKGDPAAIEGAAQNLATVEGQHKAALGESELGLGYKASPILWPSEEEAQSTFVTAIGYRVGDAGPLVGMGGAAQLHALLAHPGHTALLLIGEADDPETGRWVKMARYISRRFGADVKAIVLRRNGEPAAPDLLVDVTGTAHARLAVGNGACLCVVRPDGYLALRLRPPALSSVEDYFARIFA